MKRDLKSVLMRGTLAVAVLAIVGTGSLWIAHTYIVFQGDVERLRADGLAERRALVRDEVARAIKLIEDAQRSMDGRMRATLREQVEMARALAQSLYDLESRRHGESDARELVVEALRSLRFWGGRGYFFATTLDGRSELWPTHPEREGQSVLEATDADGRPIVKEQMAIAREKGQGFHRYRMAKPGHAEGSYPKLSYIVRFEPLGWYIGAGEYLDDFQRDVQREILLQFEAQYVRHAGYLFAGTWTGVSLLGPAEGQNLLKTAEPHVREVVRSLIEKAKQGGGVVQYEMPELEGQRAAQKISYVEGVPDWGWYVGAGTYLDEVESVVAAREARLDGQLRTQLMIILGLLILAALSAALISRGIAARTTGDIGRFASFVAEAAEGPASVDPGSFRLEELATLATTGNAMVFARDRALATVEMQRHRQTALAEIGSLLANAPVEEIDARVRESLTRIVAELGAEQCCAWRFADGDDRRTHECLTEGPSSVENLTPFLDDLRRGDAVVRNDTSDLPPDAPASEVDHHLRHGIRAFVAVPLRRAGVVVGSLHVGVHRGPRIWSDEDLAWLRAVGRAIAGAVERREGHEALARSERRLRAILDNAPIPMVEASVDGRLLGVNARFTEAFGYVREDLADRDAWWIRACPDPERRREVRTHWAGRVRAAHREGGAIPPEEYTIARADGEQRTIVVAGAFVGDHIIIVLDDVTDQRLLEEQLRQSQKLEGIGLLAGGIAHDFNNQLTGILGHTEVLRGRLEDESSRRILDQVLTASSRAAELTAQLLAFARKGKHRNEPVDLHRSIEEAVTILGRTIDKSIEIRSELEAEHPWCTGDSTQIQSALLNLALNARDAMPGGGTLTFRTVDRTLDTETAIEGARAVASGKYVEIRVSDTGVGIEGGVLPHIFDPFFTTKPEGEGTGMGLSATYGTVRRHGGTIRVDSVPGEGAVFTVLLPRGEAPVLEREEREAPDRERSGRRILIIDDEALVRETVGAMLGALGHEAVSCEEGAKGVEMAVDGPGFDLVLLDLTMPGLDGPAVFDRLQSQAPGLPVLVMSGHSVDGAAQSLLDRGAAGFLQKPCSLADLEAAVSRAGAGDRA